ncbi:WecB/TagA/CpsF family glycosyltransferase [Priestia flexa]|uniref:WecB/TagA/CpsF family glycosyltransferase n=1 Tax=Priestia flexa TaxID=86664 RepID=UPI002E1B7560|nr:WecB/TagA/CpsF family glycosyltransferase [Priestia flexa]
MIILEKKVIKLFDINFDNLTMTEAINRIEDIIIVNKTNKQSSYVVTPNVDHIVNTFKDRKFKEIYDNANLVLVDGMPIVKVSKILGKDLKEKVSGSDLTPELFKLAQKNQYRVFIFGSKEGVADKAIQKIKKEYGYDFPIEGYSPPFGFEQNPVVLNDSIQKIVNYKPDILLVSLGSPKGEMFIYNHLNTLKVPISLQIGASIDFIAGTVKRAPIWMQKASLEWFYRFSQEPKRMFKRYFVNDSLFLKIVVDEYRLKKRGS